MCGTPCSVRMISTPRARSSGDGVFGTVCRMQVARKSRGVRLAKRILSGWRQVQHRATLMRYTAFLLLLPLALGAQRVDRAEHHSFTIANFRTESGAVLPKATVV